MKYTPYDIYKLEIFESCPKLFQYDEIHKLSYDDNNIEIEKNLYIHKMINEYPNHILNNFDFKFSTKEDIDQYNKNLTILFSYSIIQQMLNKYHLQKNYQFYIYDNFENSGNILYTEFIDYMGQKESGVIDIAQWITEDITEKLVDELLFISLWVFSNKPDINKVVAGYYFIGYNTKQEYIFERKDIDIIKKYIINKINKIENEVNFFKNSDDNCKYCQYYLKCLPFNGEIEND